MYRESKVPAWLGAVGVIGVFVILVLSRGCCVGPEQTKAAKREARQWAEDLGLQVTGISCTDIDSDGDGYVSCTVALKDGQTKQIECKGAYSFGHGCRDPKLIIPQAR